MEKEDLDFISTNRLMYVNPEVMKPSHIFGNKLLTTISKILFNSPFVEFPVWHVDFQKRYLGRVECQIIGMSFSQELKIEAHIRGFKCAKFRSNIELVLEIQSSTLFKMS